MIHQNSKLQDRNVQSAVPPVATGGPTEGIMVKAQTQKQFLYLTCHFVKNAVKFYVT